MDKEDIIRMAQEGWDSDADPWLTHEQRFLERFANLVAAEVQREEHDLLCEALEVIESIMQQHMSEDDELTPAQMGVLAALLERSKT